MVQLAAPNQGSELADIANGIHLGVEFLQALSDVLAIWWLDDPLFQLIDGEVATPDIPDMQVGSNPFLSGLASAEAGYVADPPFELHTLGGTNPTLSRCHLWEFTPGSAWPLLTWNGFGWEVSFDWETWDVGLPVRNFAGDLGLLSGLPEIFPGLGDILVSQEAARLPWAAQHHVNPVSHAEALWDTSVQSQGLQVLQASVGEPKPPSPVGASWLQWTQPARVDPGPPAAHGGFYPADRGWIRQIQEALIREGFVPGVTSPASAWADGSYGDLTRQSVLRFQHSAHLAATGNVGPDDWARLLG